jgi:hypothetical protein
LKTAWAIDPRSARRLTLIFRPASLKRSVIKALAEGAEKEARKAVEKTKASVRAFVGPQHVEAVVEKLLAEPAP